MRTGLSPQAKCASTLKGWGSPSRSIKDADNVLADRFDAQVTPESYVIDSAGIIRYHGSIDDNQNESHIRTQRLRLALDAVLAGKPVDQAETKAFGCRIKRVRKSI